MPGEIYNKQSFNLHRMMGIWYRMPFGSTEVEERLTLLRVMIEGGVIKYKMFRRVVPMLQSTQHS